MIAAILTLVVHLICQAESTTSNFRKSADYKARKKEAKEFMEAISKGANEELEKTKKANVASGLGAVTGVLPGVAESFAIKALGTGFYAVVFDCDKASYYGFDNKRHDLPGDALFEMIQMKDDCDMEDTGGLWLWQNFPPKPGHIVLFDVESQKLVVKLKPYLALLTIMNMWGICDEYLKFIRHPWHFEPSIYKKPPSCSKKHVVGPGYGIQSQAHAFAQVYRLPGDVERKESK